MSHSINVCVGLLVCFIVVAKVADAGSNCALGSACDKCPEGAYKELQVGGRPLKVCCSDCHENYKAGYRLYNGSPVPYCSCYSPALIEGDCWKGDECKSCDSAWVGNINGNPVCCQNCEKSGMALSPSSCNCLHNGN